MSQARFIPRRLHHSHEVCPRGTEARLVLSQGQWRPAHQGQLTEGLRRDAGRGPQGGINGQGARGHARPANQGDGEVRSSYP
jgi:hypothetical protein